MIYSPLSSRLRLTVPTRSLRTGTATALLLLLTSSSAFAVTELVWAVSLGSETHDTAMVSIGSHGFSGWKTASFTFAPTSSSEVLSFMSIGSAAAALPPFALLDSVSATQGVIPEPSTWVMLALGFAGLGYAGFRSNRRKPEAIG
jgi:hypothetical protein